MLLEEFSTIFDRPEKVKKLREYILSLAVRGKLVEQDENDEPASILLEKIREEKDRLVKEKKIKKEKPLPKIGEDEIPYELPKGWKWVRLGQIGDWGAGATPPRGNSEYYNNGNINWLKTGELNDGYISSSEEMITELALSKCSLRLNKPGDILIAMYGATIGKLGILNIEATTNQACCGCTPYDGVYNKYLFNLLLSMRENFKSQGAGGAQPNISRQKIVNTIAPLPPLNEQKRIVEKVDYLMEFCDKLEAQLEKKVKYGSLSAKSALNSVSNCSSYEELEKTLRFIIKNFKELTLAGGAIDELKNAILSLAVKGKLVPQDEDDEPASMLLERIREEKDRLVKEKKIKKEKPLPEIGDEEVPYDLPKGWEWGRIGNLITLKGGKRIPKGHEIKHEITEHIYIRVTDMKNGSIKDTDLRYIDNETFEKIKSYIITSDDLYITIAGTIAQVGIVPKKFNNMNLTENAARIIPYIVDKIWLKTFLESNVIQESLLDKVNQMAQPKLALKRINDTLIPIPPLEEQKRIVEKVDKSIRVCDELELRIEKSKRYSEKLMESILKDSFKA